MVDPKTLTTGQKVKVLIAESKTDRPTWHPATVTGFCTGEIYEDHQRVNVELMTDGREIFGCHPACIRTDEDSGKYDFSWHCTSCGQKADQLTSESAKYINGKRVYLIQPGEALCPRCAAERGHKTLAEIHEERKEASNEV